MTRLKKTSFFGKLAVNVAAGAAKSTVKGAVNTIGDAAKIANSIAHKDFQGAFNVAGQRVTRLTTGVSQTFNVTKEVVVEVDKCVADRNRDFYTEENLRRLTQLGTVVLLVGTGITILDDSSISGAIETPDGLLPLDKFTIVTDNGVFVGDASDLQELIEAGKVEGTDHVSSDDISRSFAARTAFLKSHGFDEIPAGYDVHHIVPISQGGADTPDNMVLISEDDHNRITAEHGRFYGWHSRA